MNIDSALRMIDNEISNFGGQIKMQAGLVLPGSVKGDSTRGGRGEEEEEEWGVVGLQALGQSSLLTVLTLL